MSDRYRDRDDYYEDDSRRTSRYSSGSGQRGSSRSVESYSRQSGNYGTSGVGSTRSSNGAGAYADDYRDQGSSRRVSQSSEGGVRRSANGNPNVFQGYYPEDSVDTYRRSSYGSRSTGQSYSRGSRGAAQQSQMPRAGESAYSGDRTVVPANHSQGGRGAHSSQGDYKPKRSNRKRNAIIALVIVLAVVLIGAGAAWAYVNSISENLHKGVTQEALDALEPAEGVEATKTALADKPFYMLLMGVDMSDWRRDDPAYAGDQWGRSDSMILARVDPVNKKVALISIHRDTMVNLGEYGQQKINAAYEFYGPAGAIQAVSTMAGVPISHYATIDFDGFEALVNALGGVEVNVPMEINDDVLPCHIDAGWQVLDGEKALDLCRSRHSYDDVADDGDVMRAANQRMVIGAIAKKILSSDLMTIANSVQTLSKYVTTDLEISDIVGLAQLYKDMDPAADLYTAMEPTTSAYINDVWYEYLDEPAWKEMIARMDQGLPPVNKTEIDDRTGTVLSTGGADAPVV